MCVKKNHISLLFAALNETRQCPHESTHSILITCYFVLGFFSLHIVAKDSKTLNLVKYSLFFFDCVALKHTH